MKIKKLFKTFEDFVGYNEYRYRTFIRATLFEDEYPEGMPKEAANIFNYWRSRVLGWVLFGIAALLINYLAEYEAKFMGGPMTLATVLTIFFIIFAIIILAFALRVEYLFWKSKKYYKNQP